MFFRIFILKHLKEREQSTVLVLLQLVNHGIPVELLKRVKKVCSQCYKMEREDGFKDSLAVQLLSGLKEGKEEREQLQNLDWEDVFILQDDNDWPSQPKEFK